MVYAEALDIAQQTGVACPVQGVVLLEAEGLSTHHRLHAPAPDALSTNARLMPDYQFSVKIFLQAIRLTCPQEMARSC